MHVSPCPANHFGTGHRSCIRLPGRAGSLRLRLLLLLLTLALNLSWCPPAQLKLEISPDRSRLHWTEPSSSQAQPRFQVERSSSLDNWSPAPDEPHATGPGRFTLSLAPPENAQAQLFFRLHAPMPEPEQLSYTVRNVYPHDPAAFTQGLVVTGDRLYESTGLWGASSMREVDLHTGEVLQQHNLSSEFFGEGLALLNGRLYQLTWKSHRAFVYDASSFASTGHFTYQTEGWGLTTDGFLLIMSDGTDQLTFRDSESFGIQRTVTVREPSQRVRHLNELEWMNGQLLANQWMTERIARIDPVTGYVTAWIDLTGLRSSLPNALTAGVLNGIAYDPAGDRLFVTGKKWARLFEIKIRTR